VTHQFRIAFRIGFRVSSNRDRHHPLEPSRIGSVCSQRSSYRIYVIQPPCITLAGGHSLFEFLSQKGPEAEICGVDSNFRDLLLASCSKGPIST
jgi:hypothetical protein